MVTGAENTVFANEEYVLRFSFPADVRWDGGGTRIECQAVGTVGRLHALLVCVWMREVHWGSHCGATCAVGVSCCGRLRFLFSDECLAKRLGMGADHSVVAYGVCSDRPLFDVPYVYGPQYPIEPPEVIFVHPTPRHPHVYTNGHSTLRSLLCLFAAGILWRHVHAPR